MGKKEYQASISYIGELSHNLPEGSLLVESDEDYIQACMILSHKLRGDDDLKIWVRSKNHFVWLDDFIGQIGIAAKFEEKTARLLLVEQWNVQIPDWLTDTDVLDQNLLEISIDSQGRIDFESRFLAHFFGLPFQQEILDSTYLVDVVSALVKPEAKTIIKKYPILRRCLETKCKKWAGNSKETWVKHICERLPNNSNEVWQWFSFWADLHDYPEELLEYVLAPEQVVFIREVPPDVLQNLPLEPAAKEQMLTQIELFFNKIKDQITSSDMFRKVLKFTSGRLAKEYQFISAILQGNRFPPTAEDVKEVRIKFRYCPGVSMGQLSALSYCVKPRFPTLIGPDERWDSAQWIRWAVEEYAPYRLWQVHNRHYDEELEKTVACFTEWYMDEYISIHKDPSLSLIHCLKPLSSNRTEDEFSIVLLVDCLPVFFMDLFEDALRNVGFSRHDLQYRFAALPTSTEYNKAALLSGEWEKNGGNYETILKRRAVGEWGGKEVIYLSNLKSMTEMVAPAWNDESTAALSKKKGVVVLLNFVDGDELLHSDVESRNTTYEEELHRLFARMAESVRRLSQEWAGPREQLGVYVVTDHGACRILEEEKRSFDSMVVNKLFSNEKHRYAVVLEDQIKKIPENLWALGHRFKQPFFSEDKIYFLPDGHNTVRQTSRVKGYMHGGVTPEEVIVPTSYYKLVKAAWETPAARFLNLELMKETGRAKFYIQRVVTLEIEIQNPNHSDIHVLRASVLSPEADLKSCETVVIPAKSVNAFLLNCYFKKSALGDKTLEIEIAYEISGDQRTFPITLKSEFKSAVAGGFSLRDL